jgi:hypothetical protein
MAQLSPVTLHFIFNLQEQGTPPPLLPREKCLTPASHTIELANSSPPLPFHRINGWSAIHFLSSPPSHTHESPDPPIVLVPNSTKALNPHATLATLTSTYVDPSLPLIRARVPPVCPCSSCQRWVDGYHARVPYPAQALHRRCPNPWRGGDSPYASMVPAKCHRDHVAMSEFRDSVVSHANKRLTVVQAPNRWRRGMRIGEVYDVEMLIIEDKVASFGTIQTVMWMPDPP